MPHHFRGAEVIQVIRVCVAEGHGVEGDPVRIVEYYLTMDGELLVYNDEYEKKEAEQK